MVPLKSAIPATASETCHRTTRLKLAIAFRFAHPWCREPDAPPAARELCWSVWPAPVHSSDATDTHGARQRHPSKHDRATQTKEMSYHESTGRLRCRATGLLTLLRFRAWPTFLLMPQTFASKKTDANNPHGLPHHAGPAACCVNRRAAVACPDRVVGFQP